MLCEHIKALQIDKNKKQMIQIQKYIVAVSSQINIWKLTIVSRCRIDQYYTDSVQKALNQSN